MHVSVSVSLQAHGKVTAKEREFKQLLVAEKQRHSELLAGAPAPGDPALLVWCESSLQT